MSETTLFHYMMTVNFHYDLYDVYDVQSLRQRICNDFVLNFSVFDGLCQKRSYRSYTSYSSVEASIVGTAVDEAEGIH